MHKLRHKVFVREVWDLLKDKVDYKQSEKIHNLSLERAVRVVAYSVALPEVIAHNNGLREYLKKDGCRTYVPLIEFVLTTRCTLRCKYCSGLYQYGGGIWMCRWRHFLSPWTDLWL